MLSTLVCTMVLTLGVDVGWKPAEDGKSDIYVIQIHPEQGNRMIEEKGYITSEIPPGTREIRVQFRNEVLAKERSMPPLITTQPAETNSFDFSLTPPPSDASPYARPPKDPPPAEPSDKASSEKDDADHIVTTALNTPVKMDDPKPTKPKETPAPPAAPKDTAPKEAPKATAPDKTDKPSEPSYLTTAIASWIVSAALMAVIVYLGLIHLDLRRRYQSLLDRMLSPGDPSNPVDLPAQAPVPMDPVSMAPQPTAPKATVPLSAAAPILSPLPEAYATEFTPPGSTSSAPAENNSASEPGVQQSTLVESGTASTEKEGTSETNEQDSDQVSAGELGSELNLGGASLLLKNTNQVISQVPGEEELEAKDPRGKAAEPETVYELPESYDEHDASGNQPSDDEEDDDEDDWEGIK